MSSGTNPKPRTGATSSKPSKPASPLTKLYLILYNGLSFSLWATCTLHGLSLLANGTPLPMIFNQVYPLLLITQSLALLEILHSLVGLVRAPVATTAMQVASRILLVWGIMYLFQGRIVGNVRTITATPQTGDYAFLGCLSAWGVTECIRYGFFVLQVSGVGVPAWWAWLRYNTFYVLYPLGISSECVMVVKALGPAAELSAAYWWFLVVVLGIYVPGSYILYTHMIAQRRKALKKT
ncbi:protein tyrosine phosphatase-like domain-containing protein [Aspergillus saccharolyticus JOP 1030-1]|uniref:Very-long-chain (3R)-3-hydroxyacyl-CoA dehydratase n=1 Tax=Aspergillus saccharolyticus JOP 1030-1 TaxID=1450539 RepID=A0A318YZG7_9EURO|nr:tyrosine phosphatase-like protein [Aspergillus saccharolyticus JOP 1030-1]PYH40375.1 tyrosine phosphatase-like protein [Aspergillus saccharolyticus JOP 1030-1]